MTRNALKSPRRLRVRPPWVLAGLLTGLLAGWLSTRSERARGGAPAAVSEPVGHAGDATGGAVPGGPGSGKDSVPHDGSIAGQIGLITSFLDACARDPGALPSLLAELHLPGELRREVVETAVSRNAGKNAQAVLSGIEKLPLRTQRLRLVIRAVMAWAAESPERARDWVREQTSYPEAFGVIGDPLWKSDPDAALAELKTVPVIRRSEFIASVVFSDTR